MKGKCPICGKGYEISTLDDLPSFPFCSARCRTIDLARWADGSYTVPAPASPEPTGLEEEDDESD